MKNTKFIKIVAILLALIIVLLYGRIMFKNSENDLSFINEYEMFDSYELVSNDPIVYEVAKNNEKFGYVILFKERGYQSDIYVATYINNDGLIKNIRTIKHNETPSFFTRIENSYFFTQFIDMKIKDGFSIDSNIDAVSKATISSNAITKAIHNSANIIGQNYLDINVLNPYPKFKLKIVDIAIILMLVLAILAQKYKNKRLRTLTLTYSVIILGFKFSAFVTYSSFYQIIMFNFPDVMENFRWYLLVLGSILLVLVLGKNIYCSHICPFGAIQELENSMLKVKFSISSKTTKFLSFIPFIIAYLALILALSTEQIGALSYEPFSILYGGIGLDIQWGILFIILFLSIVLVRPYCRFVCPVGFIFKHIAKIKGYGEKLWIKK